LSQSHNSSQFQRIKAWSKFLRLPIAKRTVGILEGVHPSIFKGQGQDFDDLHIYQPGDDIRNIDWKSSAKQTIPVIKRFRADSNTNLALILDSGCQMQSRSSNGEKKIEIIEAVCEVFAYLSTSRGDAVGVVAGDSERIMNERFRLRYGGVKPVLKKVESITSTRAPKSSYSRVLAYLTQFFIKRTFFVLVFDESAYRREKEVMIPIIRRLKECHDLFVVSIRDVNPFANDAPNMLGKVIDIETENFVPAYFRRPRVAKLAKKSIKSNRDKLNRDLKGMRVAHINVDGTTDFFTKLSKILARREVAKYR
jgi:uncharacterized protein (DUF58 family)